MPEMWKIELDKDIRLIIRPNRRIRVGRMGREILYHIRAIVDDEQVVLRYWAKRRWVYTIETMTYLEICYKDGRLT